MAAKQWLIGCGVGCGLIVLLFIGLSVTCGVWFKNATSGFENAVQTRGDLDERFGQPGEFTPPADGAVPAERMEAFLAVREATAEPRQRLAKTFGGLPLSEEKARELDDQKGMEKARSVFGILGSAFGLVSGIGDFAESRNRALLEAEMGMGEYMYIYVLAYRSWLANELEDGPLGDDPSDDGNVQFDMGDIDTSNRVREHLIAMLGNQLESIPEDGDDDLRAALAAELAALRADRDRTPWEDEMPEAIAASFEPYRERLTENYAPITNAFELIRNTKRGKFSYGTD